MKRSPKHLPRQTMLSILGIVHVSFDLIAGLWFPILFLVRGQMVPIWCFMAPEMFGGVALHIQLAITAIMVLLGIKYATLQSTSWMVSFDWFAFWPVLSVSFKVIKSLKFSQGMQSFGMACLCPLGLKA